jgi:cellulose synthase/poly-beta-1,6-N-acetylglucosamine synthase-like glycosyltransferase
MIKMSTIRDQIYGIVFWIEEDFYSHPIRFCIELLAWAISIGCAITMALTVPTPPLIILYPIWIIGCSLYAWAAYTRKSFGMLANYLLLTTIDTVGLVRMLT